MRDMAKPGACCPGSMAEPVSFPASVLRPQLSYVMSGYRCFVCPVEYNNDTNSFTVDCEPSHLFRLHEYNLPEVIQSAIGWVCATPTGGTNFSGVVTAKREAPLHHCFPSKTLPSSLPKAVSPGMRENYSSECRGGAGGDLSSHFKSLGPAPLKVCFGDPFRGSMRSQLFS